MSGPGKWETHRRLISSTEPGKTLMVPQVIQYVKYQKASGLQLPERIEFMEQHPIDGTGKIDKLALKA